MTPDYVRALFHARPSCTHRLFFSLADDTARFCFDDPSFQKSEKSSSQKAKLWASVFGLDLPGSFLPALVGRPGESDFCSPAIVLIIITSVQRSLKKIFTG